MTLEDIATELVAAWGWHGIRSPIKVHDANAFGNILFETPDGRFWRLMPEELSCETIALSTPEMVSLSQDPEFRFNWKMGEIVKDAEAALGPLSKGECYALIIAASLGGTYELSNLMKVPLVEVIRLSGSLAEQIRDLPEGAQVRIQVSD